MKKPRQPTSTEPPEHAVAVFEAVPADKSETGRDEIYIVFNGKRIARRGYAGTPQAGMWLFLEPGFQVVVDGTDLIVIHDTTPPSIH